MKTCEFSAKKLSIANEIKRLNVIDKAYKVAVSLGKGKTTVYDYYTNVNFEYTDIRLYINVNDGYTWMGGGHVRVLWDGNMVMTACRPGSNIPPENIGIKDKSTDTDFIWEVQTYLKGEWTKYLTELYKNRNKIVRKNSLRKINSSQDLVPTHVVNNFKQRFHA